MNRYTLQAQRIAGLFLSRSFFKKLYRLLVWGITITLKWGGFWFAKNSIRAFIGLSYNSHTSHIFKQSKHLKLCDLFDLNFMLNYINHESSHHDYMSNSISMNSNTHKHYTRARTNLTILRFSLAASQNSFTYQSVRVWNSRPNETKISDFFNTSEEKLKNFLYSYY